MRTVRPHLSQRERRYRYAAKNQSGKTVKGTALAPDRETLSRRLHEEGLYLLSAAGETSGHGGELKTEVLAELCRQLAGLLSAGVSLTRALAIVAGEQSLDKDSRRICASMLSGVRSGISLTETMEREGAFPQLMLGMVRAGESNGTLDIAMARLAQHYEKQHRMEQSVRSALTYPAVLCVMTLLVVVGLFTLVLPQFHELFDDLPELPLPTQILMTVSDALAAHWYVLPLVLLAGAGTVRFLLTVPALRLWADHQKLKIPLVGGVLRTLYTARFARSLASLYSGGMPIVAALSTARDTLGNAWMSARFEEVLHAVRSGAALSTALKAVEGFRPKLISAIEVGEESGGLEGMLENIADTMEQDAGHHAKRLLTLLDPVLILLMALIVGFIMVGVMLPMVQSYSTLESAAYF